MKKTLIAFALVCSAGAPFGISIADDVDDPSQREIVGQLVSIQDNVYLIKDSKGTEYRFKLAADARVNKEAAPGKKVEVYVSNNDEITKLKLRE